MASGRGSHDHQICRNRRIFRNVNASSENFRNFAVGKDKGSEFYWEVIELGPPTLQVPRRTCNWQLFCGRGLLKGFTKFILPLFQLNLQQSTKVL